MTGLVATALVTIVVHNLALLPDQELKDVQSGVEHIAISGGITVRWVKDAPPLPEVSVHLMIRRQSGIGPGAAAPLSRKLAQWQWLPGRSADRSWYSDRRQKS